MEYAADARLPAPAFDVAGGTGDAPPASATTTAPDASEWIVGASERRRAEWATWAVAAAVYGGWLALTWFYHVLPWWLVLPLGGYLVAWHGSLLHESVHGHPTGSRWVNALLVFPSLWLWLPFGIYRESHLAHHACARLTCPAEDPESFYVAPAAWRAMGRVRRRLGVIRNTLVGRLLLGPAVAVCNLLVDQWRRLARGDLAHLRHWLEHAVSVLVVVAWVAVVCEIPIWQYVLLFAYPGLSLTLLRSFTEHRPGRDQADSTVIVDAGPVFSLLFLNNNLHAVHHARPELPWLLVGRRYRAEAGRSASAGRDFRFSGYAEIARRFLFRPKDSPEHPGFAVGRPRP